MRRVNNLSYTAIFPAFNEEKTIAKALTAAASFFLRLDKPFEILVVDDGSTDETAALVSETSVIRPGIRLLRHATNIGKGAAIRTGVQEARGEIILFLDCDLSVRPETFKNFLPLLETHDIIIGSRRIPGACIAEPQPWYRMRLGQIFNWLVRRRTGLPFHDTQCGFKAFKASAKGIVMDLKTNGWTFDVELLLKIKQAGYSIAEVPVEWRNGRETRVKIRDAWKIWKELCKLSE